MEIKFNIKGVIYGVILILFIVLGFVFVPKLFLDTSKPVDFTMVQRESIPEKILDIMDKYEDEERALAVKLDGKIYVIVTRGEKEHGIGIDKITMDTVEEKTVMTVDITYKDKNKSYPFVVAETNLKSLPDKIQLNATKEQK
ncbi:hypothetical protein [Terrisporobacter glycolicus]|uniref:PrcB C-terminal domain-containing protein n=1 Tax=Terrisporobacter glycolicus ATCC 14880 = DSM 1288 TaxID=1121315 RepID=A0ABZ2EPV9_9FIRM|nr:hypothetical protein [Terrisporobacter glycolicus]